jgi:hypothetical protein
VVSFAYWVHLPPSQRERLVSAYGQMMHLDLSDFIQRKIYFGCYEPKETELVRRWLRPGMNVFDVGANVGYYTALAANLVGPAGRGWLRSSRALHTRSWQSSFSEMGSRRYQHSISV